VLEQALCQSWLVAGAELRETSWRKTCTTKAHELFVWARLPTSANFSCFVFCLVGMFFLNA
jgi:hypothetical protein